MTRFIKGFSFIVSIFPQFLNLPWHPTLTKFMADHMVEDMNHNKEGDLHTQSVNSSSKVDQWKQKLSKASLWELNKTCGRTIQNHVELSMIDK